MNNENDDFIFIQLLTKTSEDIFAELLEVGLRLLEDGIILGKVDKDYFLNPA